MVAAESSVREAGEEAAPSQDAPQPQSAAVARPPPSADDPIHGASSVALPACSSSAGSSVNGTPGRMRRERAATWQHREIKRRPRTPWSTATSDSESETSTSSRNGTRSIKRSFSQHSDCSELGAPTPEEQLQAPGSSAAPSSGTWPRLSKRSSRGNLQSRLSSHDRLDVWEITRSLAREKSDLAEQLARLTSSETDCSPTQQPKQQSPQRRQQHYHHHHQDGDVYGYRSAGGWDGDGGGGDDDGARRSGSDRGVAAGMAHLEELVAAERRAAAAQHGGSSVGGDVDDSTVDAILGALQSQFKPEDGRSDEPAWHADAATHDMTIGSHDGSKVGAHGGRLHYPHVAPPPAGAWPRGGAHRMPFVAHGHARAPPRMPPHHVSHRSYPNGGGAPSDQSRGQQSSLGLHGVDCAATSMPALPPAVLSAGLSSMRGALGDGGMADDPIALAVDSVRREACAADSGSPLMLTDEQLNMYESLFDDVDFAGVVRHPLLTARAIAHGPTPRTPRPPRSIAHASRLLAPSLTPPLWPSRWSVDRRLTEDRARFALAIGHAA